MQSTGPTAIWVVSISIFILIGCAPSYKLIDPDSIDFEMQVISSSEDSIDIGWRSQILKESRNRGYAKMEKKNDISLIALRLKNVGQHPVQFPDDLMFNTEFESDIIPLSMQAAGEALIDPITNDNSSTSSIDGGWIFTLGGFLNNAKRALAHMDFANELVEEYLEDCLIYPGEELSGLIALPVRNTSGMWFEFWY